MFSIFELLYFSLPMQDNHIKFCDKYFETLNGTKSAIYAGFSEDTAKQQAWQILQREDVQQRLQSLRAEYALKSGVTKEWIVERFKNISDRCIQAEPFLDKEGNPTGDYKFDSSGANKATEMLGKIIGVFEKDNLQSKIEIPKTIAIEIVKPKDED